MLRHPNIGATQISFQKVKLFGFVTETSWINEFPMYLNWFTFAFVSKRRQVLQCNNVDIDKQIRSIDGFENGDIKRVLYLFYIQQLQVPLIDLITTHFTRFSFMLTTS